MRPKAYSSRDRKPCAEQVRPRGGWGGRGILSPSIMRDKIKSVEDETSAFEMTIYIDICVRMHACSCQAK